MTTLSIFLVVKSTGGSLMCYLMELLLLSFARGIYIHVLWYNAVKSESVVLGHGITVPQRCVCDINAQQLVDLSIN